MRHPPARPFLAAAESLLAQLRSRDLGVDALGSPGPLLGGNDGPCRPEPPELVALRRRVHEFERERTTRRQARVSAAVNGHTV